MPDRFIAPPTDPMLLGTNASAVPSGSVAAIYETTEAFESHLQEIVREMAVTLDLAPELLAWIGKLVSFWAVAEWILCGTVCSLIPIDRKLGRILLGTRIGDSASKVNQLMDAKSIERPKEWADLHRRIIECERSKNLLVHGVWMFDDELKEFCVQDPSGEWKGTNPPVSRRKYPAAFYPTNLWLSKSLEDMKGVILDLQHLDRHIAHALASHGK